MARRTARRMFLGVNREKSVINRRNRVQRFWVLPRVRKNYSLRNNSSGNNSKSGLNLFTVRIERDQASGMSTDTPGLEPGSAGAHSHTRPPKSTTSVQCFDRPA